MRNGGPALSDAAHEYAKHLIEHPEEARAFLIDAGILTAVGELAPEYTSEVTRAWPFKARVAAARFRPEYRAAREQFVDELARERDDLKLQLERMTAERDALRASLAAYGYQLAKLEPSPFDDETGCGM